MTNTSISVAGAEPYDVLIGHDLLGELPSMIAGATRVAVLYATPLHHLAEQARLQLARSGAEVTMIEVPDAEAGKSLSVADHCWSQLGKAGFTRSDAIVGVGGGAVTDLAGFVAACWLRGVRWVPVSTSLLGMVDAAVGGKTAVNTDAGKNMVGAFHPPAGVLCDLSALETLPPRDLRAGLAEVVKCGFIADPEILTLMESGSYADVLPELVQRAVQVKADVVSQDLHESGLREILNYGHTLGHAIERHEQYRWRHGDAISVGLVYAAEVGRRTGRADLVERHREILTSIGLPTTYDGDWQALLAAMRVDKKARGRALRFVLLDELAKPVTVPIDDEEMLRVAYEGIRI